MPAIKNNWVDNMLRKGEYQRAFQIREEIFTDDPERCSILPPKEKRWKGEDLNGKTFVFWSEAGFGDEIMFSQLAYYFKHELKVKHLIIFARQTVVQLLKSNLDVDEVYALEDGVTFSYDYWEWPHGLLAHISTPLQQIPRRMPFLFAEPKKIEFFSSLVKKSQQDSIAVGLVWHGRLDLPISPLRSIYDLHLLEPLLTLPNIRWFNLQFELTDEEKTWIDKHHIVNLMDNIRDFSDTAALISSLDLVISVDTSIVHLSGALGVQTFVPTLPIFSSWRWGLPQQRRTDWYDNVQIFRSLDPLANWQDILEMIRNELKQ
ncbi:glycosyltransferase family 9 protein [Rodentibacter haemolyticus]|uniref:Glycosyltransferase n=1 Tax=Rodentibacter haemolyticus TaxID=2778911 RepID=A0ABX6UY10_9PAST|nr:hypothetical protein [Rodentibacter haemolyticus]QPB42359.1 hypothetical protein IHV77_10705 [Rodentibacter haemolyticus]